MVKRLSVCLGLAMAVGCGGGASGPCAQRSGTYRTAYSLIDGNCGTGPAAEVTTTDAQLPASATERYSSDNCAVTVADATLPTGTDTVTTNGKFTWSEDGSRGAGILTLDVQDTAGVDTCHGSYTVTSDRI
jgi:hypothetical protein